MLSINFSLTQDFHNNLGIIYNGMRTKSHFYQLKHPFLVDENEMQTNVLWAIQYERLAQI